jgi:uncharacterized protein YcgI (DUF1989 family)
VIETVRVPGGEGRAALAGEGQCFRVIDVAGSQVGDLFVFTAADAGEFASASHTRVAIGKLFPRPGDPVLTNRRRPVVSESLGPIARPCGLELGRFRRGRRPCSRRGRAC